MTADQDRRRAMGAAAACAREEYRWSVVSETLERLLESSVRLDPAKRRPLQALTVGRYVWHGSRAVVRDEGLLGVLDRVRSGTPGQRTGSSPPPG